MGNATSFFRDFNDEYESSLGRSESLVEVVESGRAEPNISVDERIENSRLHRTQVSESDSKSVEEDEEEEDEEKVEERRKKNVADFESLQNDPKWGPFFHTFPEGQLVMGDKLAEGGQAVIHEAELMCSHPTWICEEYKWVLKVFKKGSSLQDLQKQWPEGMLKHNIGRVGVRDLIPRYACDVQCGTLLEDGRFAFLMQREHADLRTLIDQAMENKTDQTCGPFPIEMAGSFMQQIAQGMIWLHDQGIIHRDLKAANVLVREDDGIYLCFVADYECSVGVIGTEFWRAPEILQAVKERKVFQKPELFSNEADIFSYGMTCYEILTGKLPFDGQIAKNDYDHVINGGRPEVPKYVEFWARELLRRCWESDPKARPSFEEILRLIQHELEYGGRRRGAYWTTLVTQLISMYGSVEEEFEGGRGRRAWREQIIIDSDMVTALGSAESDSDVKERIEYSKSHWSEFSCEDMSSLSEEVAADNVEVFKNLQSFPTWGRFFRTFGYDLGIDASSGSLEVGEKFAEGGQAEIFHVHVTWSDRKMNEWDSQNGREWVLKVLKKGTLLRDLQKQWPLGWLQWCAERVERAMLTGTTLDWEKPKYICNIMCGILLEDARFAFLMEREEEDLRSLIDRSMMWKIGQDCGPFSTEIAEELMLQIALGVDLLHSHEIVHRDLKASNVLVSTMSKDGGYQCCVADYECSMGVVGTSYFRAPEILQACRERRLDAYLFTRKIDIYSYGMTCFEILTGKLPFKGHPLADEGSLLTDLVIKGLRPEVPEYVDDWARELLIRCWQSDPATRPSFGDILEAFRLRRRGTSIEALHSSDSVPGAGD